MSAVTQTLDASEARLQPQPCIIVLSGLHKGRAHWIEKPRVLIGRAEESDVHLDEVSISRQHAAIERGESGHVLIDLGSKNGSFIGVDALKDRGLLRDGDLFRLGTVSLQFFTVQAVNSSATSTTRAGPLSIDPVRQLAMVEDRALDLTTIEYQLLAALMHRPGRVLSQLALMRAAYPRDRVVSEATVASHLRNLRRKLAERNSGRDLIGSLYGRGYRIELESLPGK